MSEENEQLFELALEGEADEEVRAQLGALKTGTDSIEVPKELLGDGNSEGKEGNFHELLKSMNVAQKIKLALYGNQIARQILIKDPLRKVALFVLGNPRITDAEVIEIAGNANLDQQIYRGVSKNNSWMKNYAIKRALVFNPKTPIDVSTRWLKFILDKDLQKLSKSKNIPQVVASQSRKLLDNREKK